MTTKTSQGFTIIEVLLFLSISGALFVAMMVGVSANINTQRYRDSVTSLSGILQQQYSEVANTRNDRDDGWKCSGSTVQQDAVGGTARGTTDCVVLGRYVHTMDSGTQLQLGDIIGTVPPDTTILDSDSAALMAYAPRASTFENDTYAPEWGTVLKATDGKPSDFTVLIVRSPISGLVRSFVSDAPMQADLLSMMTSDSAKQKVTACVVPDGWFAGPTQAVIIDAATAGPSSISLSGDNNAC